LNWGDLQFRVPNEQMNPGGGTPKDFADSIAIETKKWQAVAASAGIHG
jgi:hypothetical protein